MLGHWKWICWIWLQENERKQLYKVKQKVYCVYGSNQRGQRFTQSHAVRQQKLFSWAACCVSVEKWRKTNRLMTKSILYTILSFLSVSSVAIHKYLVCFIIEHFGWTVWNSSKIVFVLTCALSLCALEDMRRRREWYVSECIKGNVELSITFLIYLHFLKPYEANYYIEIRVSDWGICCSSKRTNPEFKNIS